MFLYMGVQPQTHLGGHQIFARKVCHCDDISQKKKKKKKYAIKRVSKQMLTFFFFGDAIAVTNVSAKM